MKRVNQDVWMEDGTDDVLLKSLPDGRLEVVPSVVDKDKAAQLAMAIIDAIDGRERVAIAEYLGDEHRGM